jgi:glutathione-independent formaldehyde dehydrogenase
LPHIPRALRGAAQVYSGDAIPERLDKAGEPGALPINFIHEDTVKVIREHQSKWRSGPAFRRENPLYGVTCAIDAIGFQARAETDYTKEDPIIGVWPTADPNGIVPSLGEGKLLVPWAKLFNKNVSIGMGRDDDKRWNSNSRHDHQRRSQTKRGCEPPASS